MNDVMQVARSRKGSLEAEIAKREAEIADMREEIETLEEFMAYGDDLLKRNTKLGETDEAKQPDIKASVEANEREDDAFDTMEDDRQLAQSIAQLRPRSRPISRPA